MGFGADILQGIVAVTFVLAAIGKWRDAAGAARGAADLGVPTRLAPSVGRVLPLIEATIAVGLVVGDMADVALGAACLLLVLFSAIVGGNLVRGRHPACSCFGEASAEPISTRTLLRNGAILVASLGALFGGDGQGVVPAVAERLTDSDIRMLVVGLALVVVIEALVLLRPARRLPQLAPDPSTLALGAPAPLFELPDLDGRRHTLQSLMEPGLPTLLVFVSPSCMACDALLPEIEDWQRTFMTAFRVVVLTSGSVGRTRRSSPTAHCSRSSFRIAMLSPAHTTSRRRRLRCSCRRTPACVSPWRSAVPVFA